MAKLMEEHLQVAQELMDAASQLHRRGEFYEGHNRHLLLWTDHDSARVAAGEDDRSRMMRSRVAASRACEPALATLFRERDHLLSWVDYALDQADKCAEGPAECSQAEEALAAYRERQAADPVLRADSRF